MKNKIVLLLILYLASCQLLVGQSTCIGDVAKLEWKYWRGLSGSNIDILYDHVYYPQAPDGKLYVSRLNAPKDFDEYYGSSLRGFIRIAETGTHQFNITADNKAEFLLSSDDNPANASVICSCPGPTKGVEHNKYGAQTSIQLQLNQGDYLYFEMNLKERTGVDHGEVFWKTPSSSSTWNSLPSNVLYEYICDVECDVKGTPCDDGNANTIDDREDGHCNCFGVPVVQNTTCIGTRGQIMSMYYDDIAGTTLNWLRVNAKFPMLPDRASFFNRWYMPGDYGDDYGSYIRGFLTPPVSGNYSFNLVGNHQCEFYLSTDHTYDGSLPLTCSIPGFTSLGQHYKYASQTSDSIYLEKGKTYYFEALQKESANSDHIAVYWRTPYADDDTWRIIDGIYLNSFNCELACLPIGTACDDGDAETKLDSVDANCDCVGIPCYGPCLPDPTYVPTDACALTNEHGKKQTDSWLSCEKSMSPNHQRGNSHFIMYDFGKQVMLQSLRYWNYNIAGSTRKGAKKVVIDYSDDGSTWTEMDTFTWNKAPGQNNYTGSNLNGFSSVTAKYLLLTIIETRSVNSDCAGFSEILFEVEDCGLAGSACDDGDPNTTYDMFDENCNCAGINLMTTNDCDPNVLVLNNSSYPSGQYDARFHVRSNATISENTVVHYIARDVITLEPGFKTELGSGFLAIQADCHQASSGTNQAYDDVVTPTYVEEVLDGPLQVRIENDAIVLSDIHLNQPSQVSIMLEDAIGQQTILVPAISYELAGRYRKFLTFKKVTPGVYQLKIITGEHTSSSQVVVLD